MIFDETRSLVGAVAPERYRWMIDWILAGEAGAVIPLAPDADAPTAPGQSRVGGGEKDANL